MSDSTNIDPADILDQFTKVTYQVKWDSPFGYTWWPGEGRAWSLPKSCFEHTAICDTPKGAQAVCDAAARDGGTNITVMRWKTVTITTRAQEVDLRALVAATERAKEGTP